MTTVFMVSSGKAFGDVSKDVTDVAMGVPGIHEKISITGLVARKPLVRAANESEDGARGLAPEIS
jgi:hypothetical protein